MKAICIALLMTAALPFTALALDPPTGEVVLTVEGRLDHPNVGQTAQFDLAMLEKLARRTGEMETPWTEGKVRFSVRDKGPLFLVYPFDTNPETYNEKYFSRSVWQIKEIEVGE